MALNNPKRFGLNVLSFFADVENKNLSLQNINLPPLDIAVILGSGDAGATRNDWISFARLVSPLHKTLDRFDKDSAQFEGLLRTRAGADGSLFGNLKINGSLSGNAIRYRYVEGTGGSSSVRIADISTSRVSAWSSSDPKATNADPAVQAEAKISYGARVGITTGGELKFGTQAASVSGPRLQTTLVPQVKEFASEVPTHKIETSIGTLYAMKGIPIILKGFFRNLNATIKIQNSTPFIPASWKIVETRNASAYSNFRDQGGTTSTINYRSSVSRERFIQIYYNPDRILDISVTSANIRSLPAVKFKNATRIEFSYNQLREFPDINFIAPDIEELLLRRNPFYLSEFENERKLQNTGYTSGATTGTVLDKIPTNLKRLYLEGTFYGSITQNIIANRFTGLTVFDVGRGSGAYFHPDTADSSSTMPNVPNTIETYNIQSNDFRSIDNTASGTGNTFNVKQLTNVINLRLGGNYYLSDNGFSISTNNNVLVTLTTNSTALPLPTGLIGKIAFKTFEGTYMRNAGKLVNLEGGNSVSYVFDNCPALERIALYASQLSDSRFPIFTNPSLTHLDLRYTNIKGGAPDGTETFVIPRETFQFTTQLRNLYIDSNKLLTSPINSDALTDIGELYYFWYRSYGRTTGGLPSFSGNPKLTYVWMHHNNFTSGVAPNFAANPQIYYVRLSNNKLGGSIPTYRNLSKLYYLFLQDNNFTGIGEFENLPRLRYLYVHNNSIQGEIPDLSECPRLYYLIMFNNNFTSYKSGSFKELYNIRYIDLSNNNLSEQAVEKIIEDLYDNYNAVNRGRITLNLRGCGAPSESALELITILKSKGWNITHD